ncbi:uncharacterized protein LOC108180199 [Tachysurus ichikawai]
MFCSHENLERILQDIQSRQNSVYQHYQPILRNNATFPDIANRMDACAALTAEISDLVSKRLQTIDEDYNEVLVKERQAVCEEHKAQPSQDNVALAQAIADSLSTHRLPVPEPTIFAGDPLKFIDWKMSFMTLIDRKSLPPGEKMFYLKNYLVGEARKAVEGYFYRNSEDAYQGAWKVLQDRYGNPFILQRAFRDKLMRWPKIGGNDPLALRDFTDFLQGCVEAIPHVKGLAILNDCEENHKLLKKLPEWIIRKWNRIVVEKLDASGDYPSFKHFTEFMQKETRIACNPITSPVFMNLKNLDERFPKRAKALSTKADVKDFSSKRLETFSFKPKVTCFICEDEKHNIAQCPTFAERTIEDKKTFVQENHLCFGCLRKGHIFKDCKRRHKCGTCGRNHPTCLHEERDKLPLKASRKTSTEVQASQEVHKVMAHVLTQSSCATSSIVPVFISTVEEPQREVLTYALLDTQSDSSFILEDLLDDLNTITQPVQLRLSTMTAVDTITASKRVVARIKRLGSKQKFPSDHVTVEERQKAAEAVIKLVQQEAFSKETRMIEKRKFLPNSSALYHLDPIFDKGLLRVGGRLKRSSLIPELKHPVVLPKESYITNLILSHYHTKVCHQGRNQTQMELRMNGFWIIGGIHIEMIEDLSTDAFINALRCFISLRGAVRKLQCDHGTNFVGARNELKESMKQVDPKALEVFLSEKQCEFVFNALSASHAGGIWERQIRTVRNVLNATLAQCPGRLDDASLKTLFYEAMAIVNSRPLTVDSINDPNSLEPLTPNHLILMKSDVPPPGKFVKEDMYATKRWHRVQYLIEQFWSRWKKEYLLNISTHQKWHTPRRNLRINDVVIIREDMLPRSQWQLGRVIETVKESDGLVRRVKVQVGGRKRDQPSKPTIIERPIQKLVVLLEEE